MGALVVLAGAGQTEIPVTIPASVNSAAAALFAKWFSE
jgi:hypothetical protein